MLIDMIRSVYRPQRFSVQRLSATDSQSALESLYRANKKNNIYLESQTVS